MALVKSHHFQHSEIRIAPKFVRPKIRDDIEHAPVLVREEPVDARAAGQDVDIAVVEHGLTGAVVAIEPEAGRKPGASGDVGNAR